MPDDHRMTPSPRRFGQVIGLRPGEKMHETLTAQGLDMRRTAFSRIWMARQQEVPRIEVYRALRGLRRACAAGVDAGVIEALTMAVTDYEPSEAVAPPVPSVRKTPARRLTTAGSGPVPLQDR